jgi:cytochrome c peroxidase
MAVLFVVYLKGAELITPIPLYTQYDRSVAVLGEKLFNDSVISKDGTISCALCHIKKSYFTNHLKTPIGKNGYVFSRNTISLLNEKYKYYYEWDGRFKTLEKCVEAALKDAHETDLTPENITKKLKNTKYQKMFFYVFKDGLNEKNLIKAFTEYIKSLTTPNSAFDRYLRGDKNAISAKAKKGYRLFISKGCVACHNGMLLGGNVIAKFGFMKNVRAGDKGRYLITRNKDDLYYFKVPGLRNVANTYPYMHDGRIEKLKDAVKFMLRYQLYKVYTQEEVDNITEFLKTLSGEINEK